MVHEIVNGTYRQTNLTNEPEDYLAAREKLRLAEIELMKQRERVAEMRRALPKGVAVKDYEFLEGPRDLHAGDAPIRKVKMSELCTAPNRPLVIYQFMYGKLNAKPCPMCTLWIDGINGVAHHIAQNIDFAIVAAAEPMPLREHARRRGWDSLRLLSADENTFKYDFGGEKTDGGQDSTLNVFSKDADGTIRHFYSCHPKMSPEINERGIDLLVPVYNMMDFTPQGRGSWYASFAYAPKAHIASA